MPYLIDDEVFSTKEMVRQRCRQILERTPDGQPVVDVDAAFLFALFQYHDEWVEKSLGGVRDLSTQTTIHGTRCFIIRKHSRDEIDISFPHTIRLLPSARSASLQPQGLRDFRSGARVAIRQQIYEFRDQAFQVATTCPITGEPLTRSNVAVDHIAPDTFDILLFRFCCQHQVNPLMIRIGSQGGVMAVIEDELLSLNWQEFHRHHARLRLISRTGNLQLNKASVPWQQLYS